MSFNPGLSTTFLFDKSVLIIASIFCELAIVADWTSNWNGRWTLLGLVSKFY